jgi:ATP-binding cassette subfamily B protein RaxB
VLLGFVIQLLSLCTPVVTQWTIDNVVSVGNTSMLATSVFVLALVLVLRILFDIGRGWLVCHSTAMFSVRWRSTLVEHLLRLPLDYFGQRHAGTIASNFNAT